tara:strand:- start:30915 stop:32153 length:1239 start_codon:yes stop_codon:yes gene_type:complete
MEAFISTDKNLLIIGAGAEQAPAYKIAKEQGIKTIATDSDPYAPSVTLADYFINASTRDAEQTARMARDFSKEIPIHGVMTIANDVPYTVSHTASELGLPSISKESAKIASDKILMKKLFIDNNIPCPTYYEISKFEEFKQLIGNNTEQKFVIKPNDGRGARGVLIIDEEIDLNWAYQESTAWGDSGKLILEEYVEGKQYSTESFIIEDQCFTPAIAERNYSRLNQFKPYIIEDGGDIPPDLSESQLQKIDRLIMDSASAIGIEEGIIKGDIVIDNDGNIKIIEIAARLSGGWFATHQVPVASGVNLVEIVMRHSLSLPINRSDLMPNLNKATSIRYWFPNEGLIKEISGIEALKETPGLVKYGFFRGKGEIQPTIRMHPDRFGYVIVSGKDREEAEHFCQMALDSITIEVE